MECYYSSVVDVLCQPERVVPSCRGFVTITSRKVLISRGKGLAPGSVPTVKRANVLIRCHWKINHENVNTIDLGTRSRNPVLDLISMLCFYCIRVPFHSGTSEHYSFPCLSVRPKGLRLIRMQCNSTIPPY